MSQSSPGQMTWRPNDEPNADKLHLRRSPSEPWRPYHDFPEYIRPDPDGFSQGYATFLMLLKQDWILI